MPHLQARVPAEGRLRPRAGVGRAFPPSSWRPPGSKPEEKQPTPPASPQSRTEGDEQGEYRMNAVLKVLGGAAVTAAILAAAVYLTLVP